jgi:glycosyltransferase involved in cell wall biosynthesis
MAGVTQGGIGRYVEEVVRALARTNEEFRISLFVRKANWDLFELDSRFQKVLADIPWYGVREQFEIPGVFRRAGCDLYHVPHFNVPLRMPRPFVFTLHDLIMWERGEERDTTRSPIVSKIKSGAMKAVVRNALKRCAACVAPSQWVAGRIQPVTGVKPKRVEVVHEGAETLGRVRSAAWEAIASRFQLHKPYVLTVGNVYAHKNIPMVIDAISLLQEKFPLLHHVHAGPAHPKKFYDEVVRYGTVKLSARFHHVENVSDEELAALYRHAVCTITPSRMEGFALPALEAMSLGTPVIAAQAHCFPELLGNAARYVPVDDVRALAEAIAELLTDEGKRAEFAGRGKIQAAHYTWAKHAEKVFGLYQSLL